jgi:hypothetical protein
MLEPFKSIDLSFLLFRIPRLQQAKQGYHKMIRIAEVPGKGVGVFATQSITAGTMILSEKPMVVVPPFVPQPELNILRQLQGLTADEKKAFFALRNGHPDMKPVMGIMKTNAMPLGEGASTCGIFPKCARFNHSCSPNAVYSWNEEVKEERVFSLSNISEGEEISVSYFSDEVWAQAYDLRVEVLSYDFGFTCAYTQCLTSREEDREQSDARRAIIRLLQDQVGDGMLIMNDPSKALGMCRAALELMQLEGSQAWGLERIYYDAFQICICHGDMARAKAFIGLSIQAKKAWKGIDAAGLADQERLEREPKTHRLAFTTRRWAACNAHSGSGTPAEDQEWLWRRAS